jgi:Cysteine-rich secretory protein family
MVWLVQKHNELRARHGVQALVWDWNLAWHAYDYVSACPDGHSGVQGIGENLAWGHNDFNHAMRDWYDEVCGWGWLVIRMHAWTALGDHGRPLMGMRTGMRTETRTRTHTLAHRSNSTASAPQDLLSIQDISLR